MAELTSPTPTSSCCSAETQATCCEPSDKDACCGTEATAGDCGCAAAAPEPDIRETVRVRRCCAAGE